MTLAERIEEILAEDANTHVYVGALSGWLVIERAEDICEALNKKDKSFTDELKRMIDIYKSRGMVKQSRKDKARLKNYIPLLSREIIDDYRITDGIAIIVEGEDKGSLFDWGSAHPEDRKPMTEFNTNGFNNLIIAVFASAGKEYARMPYKKRATRRFGLSARQLCSLSKSANTAVIPDYAKDIPVPVMHSIQTLTTPEIKLMDELPIWLMDDIDRMLDGNKHKSA